MKKILSICVMCFAVLLFATACGKTDLDYVNQNMSEKTEIFFYAENENFYSTLSVGQREKNYYMDGKSGEIVDFSLLTLNFFEEKNADLINVVVEINCEKIASEMEFNPINATFMVDLERKILANDEVCVKFEDEKLTLENISKDFGVDCDEAIEIACKELSKQINEAKEHSTLNGECYLKILDKRANNFENFYWCFTLLTKDNKSFSVVISTTDGKILAKTK